MNHKICSFQLSDIPTIQTIYQNAFAGFPWYENLSTSEISKRLNNCINKPGFNGIIYTINNEIAGAIWWDTPTIKQLEKERGQQLAHFPSNSKQTIIWEREIIVHPNLHDKGIGTLLRKNFLKIITCHLQNYIILTRMRDDNLGIIHIGKKIGFQRTGIRTPSSMNHKIFHEYWYLQSPR